MLHRGALIGVLSIILAEFYKQMAMDGFFEEEVTRLLMHQTGNLLGGLVMRATKRDNLPLLHTTHQTAVRKASLLLSPSLHPLKPFMSEVYWILIQYIKRLPLLTKTEV